MEDEDDDAGNLDIIESAADQERRKQVNLPYGDKFTKKPLQAGKYLILLGRMHIQAFSVQDFRTKILFSHGEDQAER